MDFIEIKKTPSGRYYWREFAGATSKGGRWDRLSKSDAEARIKNARYQDNIVCEIGKSVTYVN